jgi:putative endonuclease
MVRSKNTPLKQHRLLFNGPKNMQKQTRKLTRVSKYSFVLSIPKEIVEKYGWFTLLKLRFERHKKGLVESTKNRRPLKLIYYEACLLQDDVTRREKYLKTVYGKRFIKSRLKSYLTGK